LRDRRSQLERRQLSDANSCRHETSATMRPRLRLGWASLQAAGHAEKAARMNRRGQGTTSRASHVRPRTGSRRSVDADETLDREIDWKDGAEGPHRVRDCLATPAGRKMIVCGIDKSRSLPPAMTRRLLRISACGGSNCCRSVGTRSGQCRPAVYGAYRVAELRVIGGLSSTGAVGAAFLSGWNRVPNRPAQRRRRPTWRMRCGAFGDEN